MKLTVPDTARLFSVPEETIYRWVREGSIPYARVSEQVRFNRADLLEWATARGLPVSIDIFPYAGGTVLHLSDALEQGGVHHGVGGGDRDAVLHAVVAAMPLGDAVDREALFQILLAREGLGSTAVGDGIAIPHVGNPLVLEVDRPSVTLCFLEGPVDFHAADGRPVTTLFALLTPTVRAHLHLLSRLSGALHDPGFRAAVVRRASGAEILSEARRVEAAFPPPVLGSGA